MLLFKSKRILLDGLQLYPSIIYSSTLNGLIGTFDKSQDIANITSDGGIIGNSKITSKKINLDVGIKNGSIKDCLNIYSIVQKRKCKLQVEYDYVGVLEAEIFVDSIATDRLESKISIVATIENPYIETTNTKEIELGVIKEGGIIVDNTARRFPLVFNTTITGNRGTVTNNCMCTCWSIIEIKGMCSNLEIENVTTAEKMIININLSADDILIIDSRPSTRGIYLNGNRRPDLKNGDWLSVVQGDNVFKFNRVAGMNDNTKKHCKVMFKERWI